MRILCKISVLKNGIAEQTFVFSERLGEGYHISALKSSVWHFTKNFSDFTKTCFAGRRNKMPQNSRNRTRKALGRTLAAFWCIDTFFFLAPVSRRNICNNFASSVKVSLFCIANCSFFAAKAAIDHQPKPLQVLLQYIIKILNLRIASCVGARVPLRCADV